MSQVPELAPPLSKPLLQFIKLRVQFQQNSGVREILSMCSVPLRPVPSCIVFPRSPSGV